MILGISGCGIIINDEFDPTGTYELDNITEKKDGETYGYFGEIKVKKIQNDKIIMTFFICKGAPSYNLGSFIDTIEINNNFADYKNDDDFNCKINFKFFNEGIEVEHLIDVNDFLCVDFGNGVRADGFFKKISSEVPIIRDPLTDELLE